MNEEFVPKNGNGGYNVKVLWRNDAWTAEGEKSDFYDLTGMGWRHFLDLANRAGHERAKAFLLKNGFKLS